MDAENVVRTYSDMVYGIARRYAKTPEDADDIYSETFLAYFRKERTFESEDHRKFWLIRVTINCAKSFLGTKTFDDELNEEIVADGDEQATTEEVLDLHAAIDKLAPAYKEVICLFYLNDLPVREISAITGKTENNVKVMLSRARDMLRQFLED